MFVIFRIVLPRGFFLYHTINTMQHKTFFTRIYRLFLVYRSLTLPKWSLILLWKSISGFQSLFSFFRSLNKFLPQCSL